MTSTTRTASPRNKTGVYAAPSLSDVKSTENPLVVAPPASSQNRNTRSAKLLLALSEQKQHRLRQSRLSKQELTQYHAVEEENETTTDSHSSTNGMRNGFRPSSIRRQKQRILTAMTHRGDHSPDLKEFSLGQSFIPSPGSARLQSEIDHISSKLKLNDESSRGSRFQQTRDITGTPHSALSNFTSYRPSSASTNPGFGRIHSRFPSTLKNATTNTVVSIPGVVPMSNKSSQISATLPTSSSLTNEDHNRQYVNYHGAHAYQIPQRSNIGSESAFPSTSLMTTIKKRATKNNIRTSGKKTISCPFYVMYLTNLTIQQASQNDQKKSDHEKRSSAIPLATPRSGTAASRIGTAYSRHTAARQQINSPLSMHSRSTIDDDDDENSILNITPYYNKKRFSAKFTAFENENSYLLKDVLRTTAWNHVQM